MNHGNELRLQFSKLKQGVTGYLFWICVVFAVGMFVLESVRQSSENDFVRRTAWEIVDRAGAKDNESRIIALRDYLRANIQYQGAPAIDRPFLRSTAAETLRSRKGYCGEVSRTFIRLADAVGIRAQRINLYGRSMHVVAEAEVEPRKHVIVDAQNPPQIADLETLDRVILRPEYDDYSTLNLRRLKLAWLFSRVKLQMGPLAYWSENPHALRATVWLLGAMFLVTARFGFKFVQAAGRKYLIRRGWVRNAIVSGT